MEVKLLSSLLASVGGFILLLEILSITIVFVVENLMLNVDVLASLLIMPVIVALITYAICSRVLSMFDRLVRRVSVVVIGREAVYVPNIYIGRADALSFYKDLPIKLLLLVLGTVGLGYPAALLILANLANKYLEMVGCKNVIDRRIRALQPATLGLAGALLISKIKHSVDKCFSERKGLERVLEVER